MSKQYRINKIIAKPNKNTNMDLNDFQGVYLDFTKPL